MGNNSGEILYGVFVTFPPALREAYGKVLKGIYDNSIKFIHEGSTPPANLEQVPQCVKFKKGAPTPYTFAVETSLWRDVKQMDMPLPPIKGIVPRVVAEWNAVKGGSDATSNLLWRCKGDPPPQDTNQASVLGRQLGLGGVTLHRVNQMCTAKEDLDFFG